jgi:hypothetical protein
MQNVISSFLFSFILIPRTHIFFYVQFYLVSPSATRLDTVVIAEFSGFRNQQRTGIRAENGPGGPRAGPGRA